MEIYADTLMYTISAITKIYLVYTIAFVGILVFSLIFKRKKVRNAMLAFLICTLITYSILVVPRCLDLRDDSFIKVEKATITLDDFYRFSTEIRFFGFANIVCSDGKTVEVTGAEFFEWPSSDELEEFYGDIVYAKRSRQLVAMKKY